MQGSFSPAFLLGGECMNVVLVGINAKYIHKNLALRYLYQTCPSHHHVEFIEFTIKEDVSKVGDCILSYGADVVGISTYIWNVEFVKALTEYLKNNNPSITIFLGGPEVSFQPHYFLSNFKIDAVSCGEGEFTVWKYMDALEQNINDFDIPGIFTRDITPTQSYAITSLTELENYNLPYFLDRDMESMDKQYLYVETSRGCPYQCSYCLSSAQGGVRLFSFEYVIQILDKIFESNAKQIKFLDRTFNVDKKRAIELAKYINEKAPKDQSYQFEIMAEHLSDELIEYLENRTTGPKFRFEIGIQTTNVDALKEIKRVQDFEKLSSVIKRLSKSNLCELHVDLIAGLPLEGFESFHHSFNDVFYLRPDELQLGFLKLLRGTYMRDNADEYKFIYSSEAPYEIIETAWISKEEVESIRDVAYALENLYNKGRMRHSIDYLVYGKGFDPFELFMVLGKKLRAIRPKNYYSLFTCVYEILLSEFNCNEIIGWLNEEYYSLSKQKVKRISTFEMIDRETILKGLVDYGVGTMNQLINYGIFAQGVQGILFVLYNSEQTYPKLYVINQQGEIILKEN